MNIAKVSRNKLRVILNCFFSPTNHLYIVHQKKQLSLFLSFSIPGFYLGIYITKSGNNNNQRVYNEKKERKKERKKKKERKRKRKNETVVSFFFV